MKAFLHGLIVAVVFGIGFDSTVAAEKPNIVFLFADDLGSGDLACYGHPYSRTPNLDRLASEGTRFTQFYVTGVTCCPSRTGFMTSKFPATYERYPADHGFGERVTITELLKKNGYACGHFGKWHIGDVESPGTYGMDDIIISGGPAQERGRDAPIYDDAIRFIEAHRDVPFYVNVWGHITHHPVLPPQSYADKFRDVTIDEAAFSPPMREKFTLVKNHGGDVQTAMRNYLGDLLSLDDDVGRLLKRLDELGLRENTIVVFSSDQGAPMAAVENQRRAKKSGRNDITIRMNLMGYNGVFRGGKHTMNEGGVRSPFIVRWPGHVPVGRVDQESVISGIDWLPTLCGITGITIDPADFDGENVVDSWLGEIHTRTKPLFWKTGADDSPAGMREGTWKLMMPERRRGEVQLYDLRTDVEEQHNLAANHPDVVRELTVKITAWTDSLPKHYVKSKDKGD